MSETRVVADAAGWTAGAMCIIAVVPLVGLAEAPFSRRLTTIVAAILAGRCTYAAIDGEGAWGLAVLAAGLAAVSLLNLFTWRRARA